MYFKIFMSFLISLLLVLVCMPSLISYLKSISFNQNINEYALKEFKDKAKTPTMGGMIFVLVPIIVTIVFDIEAIYDLDTMIVLLSQTKLPDSSNPLSDIVGAVQPHVMQRYLIPHDRMLTSV